MKGDGTLPAASRKRCGVSRNPSRRARESEHSLAYRCLSSMLRRMLLLSFVCCCNLRSAAMSNAAVTGVWRAQMDGLPALTMTITDESGTLAGAVLFYLI